MAFLFGQSLNKTEILRRVGDISQMAGALPFEYTFGKAKGTRAIEIRNGSGLRFVVLPDRGMDIAYAEYKGTAVSYISKTGITSPSHYNEQDFSRSFYGGLLTTCGLTYMGASCIDEGIALGAHGRISNIPAFDVGITQEWCGDEFIISVKGKVQESTLFGENIVLTRTITTKLGKDEISIHDAIENVGFEPTPLMVLYHMNFGYPLFSEEAVFETNCGGLRARDEEANKGIEKTNKFSKPVHGYKEQVFYRNSVENSYALLKNEKIGLTAKVEYDGTELPYLIEWKQVGEQDYVLGIEPATYPPDGRAKARKRGELLYLQPQKNKFHSITISFSR